MTAKEIAGSRRPDGVYGLGYAGYEIWLDPEDDGVLIARYTYPGADGKYHPRKYHVKFTAKDRGYICPDRQRIYLDNILRTNIP